MPRYAVSSFAALVLSISGAGVGAALSQEPIANRYTLEKIGNGFVRLDTQTGEMSICMRQDGQLVCKLAADERRAFEDTLSELSDRVAALEQRLDIAGSEDTGDQIPNDAELDRALKAMKKMMQGFMGMVEDLRKDFGDDATTPPEGIPDRT